MNVIIVTSKGVESVTNQNVAPVDYTKKSISELAYLIKKDWKATRAQGVHPYAKPYLDAMECLNSISDNYGADSGHSVVAYFLGNAAQWKGETAKIIKAELKNRLKAR